VTRFQELNRSVIASVTTPIFLVALETRWAAGLDAAERFVTGFTKLYAQYATTVLKSFPSAPTTLPALHVITNPHKEWLEEHCVNDP